MSARLSKSRASSTCELPLAQWQERYRQAVAAAGLESDLKLLPGEPGKSVQSQQRVFSSLSRVQSQEVL